MANTRLLRWHTFSARSPSYSSILADTSHDLSPSQAHIIHSTFMLARTRQVLRKRLKSATLAELSLGSPCQICKICIWWIAWWIGLTCSYAKTHLSSYLWPSELTKKWKKYTSLQANALQGKAISPAKASKGILYCAICAVLHSHIPKRSRLEIGSVKMGPLVSIPAVGQVVHDKRFGVDVFPNHQPLLLHILHTELLIRTTSPAIKEGKEVDAVYLHPHGLGMPPVARFLPRSFLGLFCRFQTHLRRRMFHGFGNSVCLRYVCWGKSTSSIKPSGAMQIFSHCPCSFDAVYVPCWPYHMLRRVGELLLSI